MCLSWEDLQTIINLFLHGVYKSGSDRLAWNESTKVLGIMPLKQGDADALRQARF
ncbi:hypothetical protein [Virgibacillus dokdonensis]|uniref:hypothetical protein n=1 Tax=Virgibacillus dokdonensis TaxID=302167 RepID=UPI002F920C15